MQALVSNLRPQDHTQSYGEYCLNTALTPEYRELIVTASLDWLVMQYVVNLGGESLRNDVVSTAILQHVESLNGDDRAYFSEGVDNY